MKLFEVIIAVVCIFIAIYNLDIYNLDRTIISILLFMQAVMLLTSNKKLKKILRNSSVVLAIFLIARFLFGF
jgi:hypothetical protein